MLGNSINKTEDFIQKAKKVHGDKYDYSKVEYVNTNKYVTIICRVHDEWEQKPSNHLSGRNCPKCKGFNKTTEEYIAQAKAVHGDKYDYSNTIYNGADKNITAICPIHGEFEQQANSHLRGSNCPNCSGRNQTNDDFIRKAKVIHGDTYDYSNLRFIKSKNYKLAVINCRIHGEFEQSVFAHIKGQGCKKCAKRYMDTDYFIAESKKVHGNKYDYSLSKFVDSTIPIKIICREHGEFEQVPPSHLKGMGCRKCGIIKSRLSRKKIELDEFIQKANEIHDNKYDYSKVQFENKSSTILIICPEHGEFPQKVSSHLNGAGCQKCAKNAQLDTAEFIRRARKIHGDKFDYSKVEYVNNHTKVIIICPIHGEFPQLPPNHLNSKGKGCKKCTGRGIKFLTYEEAKKIIHPVMQTIAKTKGRRVTQDDYFKWYDENREYCQKIGLPRQPDSYYKTHK